jgi:hypothetical protein
MESKARLQTQAAVIPVKRLTAKAQLATLAKGNGSQLAHRNQPPKTLKNTAAPTLVGSDRFQLIGGLEKRVTGWLTH